MFRTYTGKSVDPWDLRSNDIDLRDVAHHLSLLNRFAGATEEPYSVAQHSVLCAQQASSKEIARYALVHDCTEAYGNDVIRSLKYKLPDYLAWEGRIWKVCALSLGLDPEMPLEVKDIDRKMLVTEKRDLFKDEGLTQFGYSFDLEPWPAKVAEERFLSSFKTLFGRDTWHHVAYYLY